MSSAERQQMILLVANMPGKSQGSRDAPRIHDPNRDGPYGEPYESPTMPEIDPQLKNARTKKRKAIVSEDESDGDDEREGDEQEYLHCGKPPGSSPPPPSSDHDDSRSSPPTEIRHSRKRGHTRVGRHPGRRPGRGDLAVRGKSKKPRGATRSRVQDASDDSADENLPEDFEDLSSGSTKTLTGNGQQAKARLQKLVVRKFREICGVGANVPWPPVEPPRINTASGEPYYTPDFDENVEHRTNVEVFNKVASLLMDDLKVRKDRPPALQATGVWFNKHTIFNLAKMAHRGFKPKAMASRDAEKAAKHALNKQKTRHTDRRKLVRTFGAREHLLIQLVQKFGQLLTAVDRYVELHQCDPTNLLCEEMMSDYASGPEDEDIEVAEDWKLRMAKEQGVDGRRMPANNFEKMVFWERIHPEWRSEELTRVFVELESIWWSSLSVKERKKFVTIKVSTTGRSSSIPPAKAPYNFGICQEWLDQHKDEYTDMILDWGEYPDPPGFGTSAEELTAAEAGEVEDMSEK
ncbi:hypothetical protein HWV62_14298 [Athelia sp. TMB]|nr:hypothetical protein HWV62_14298 [Athelia sp. TMB]